VQEFVFEHRQVQRHFPHQILLGSLAMENVADFGE
jgi:hypothetical protein